MAFILKNLLNILKKLTFKIYFRTECYCGNSLTNNSFAGSDTECNLNCTGDLSKQCGSSNRSSVYFTKNAGRDFIITSDSSVLYLGCFSSDAFSSQLSYLSNLMTIQLCIKYCKDQNFTFSILQSK